MLGASFGSSAKGTGLKALEFALSICETVDMYGFTVDPGYKEWLSKIKTPSALACMQTIILFLPELASLFLAGLGTFQSLGRGILHFMVGHIIK